MFVRSSGAVATTTTKTMTATNGSKWFSKLGFNTYEHAYVRNLFSARITINNNHNILINIKIFNGPKKINTNNIVYGTIPRRISFVLVSCESELKNRKLCVIAGKGIVFYFFSSSFNRALPIGSDKKNPQPQNITSDQKGATNKRTQRMKAKKKHPACTEKFSVINTNLY